MTPGPAKAGAGVGVGPSVAAVSGPIEQVRVVVRKASTPFVHARDVDVACGEIAGDLDIAERRRR